MTLSPIPFKLSFRLHAAAALASLYTGVSTPNDVRPVVVIGLAKWRVAVTSMPVGSRHDDTPELKDVARSALAVSGGKPPPAADNRTWVQVRTRLKAGTGTGLPSATKWIIFDPTTNRLCSEVGPVTFGKTHENILQGTREAFGRAAFGIENETKSKKPRARHSGEVLSKVTSELNSKQGRVGQFHRKRGHGRS